MPRSRAFAGGCWHRGLGAPPCPVAAQEGRHGQRRCSARLQHHPFGLVFIHAVSHGAGMWDSGRCHPWELGSTDTILPQCRTLQRSSVFCSLCHKLSVEARGKKGPHKGFPLPLCCPGHSPVTCSIKRGERGEKGKTPVLGAGQGRKSCTRCFGEVWGKRDWRSKQGFHSHMCQLRHAAQPRHTQTCTTHEHTRRDARGAGRTACSDARAMQPGSNAERLSPMRGHRCSLQGRIPRGVLRATCGLRHVLKRQSWSPGCLRAPSVLLAGHPLGRTWAGFPAPWELCGAGVSADRICAVAGTEWATRSGLRIYLWGYWGLRKLRCCLTGSGVGEANPDDAKG